MNAESGKREPTIQLQLITKFFLNVDYRMGRERGEQAMYSHTVLTKYP